MKKDIYVLIEVYSKKSYFFQTRKKKKQFNSSGKGKLKMLYLFGTRKKIEKKMIKKKRRKEIFSHSIFDYCAHPC